MDGEWIGNGFPSSSKSAATQKTCSFLGSVFVDTFIKCKKLAGI
jgi:hypothetical protein